MLVLRNQVREQWYKSQTMGIYNLKRIWLLEAVMVATLQENIARYDAIKEELEQECLGQWIVIYDCELIGSFEDFQDAAETAVTRFGRGPYLIRRVGVERPSLPVSLMYRGVPVAN